MPFVETKDAVQGDVLMPPGPEQAAPDNRSFSEAFGEAAAPAYRLQNSVVSTFNFLRGIGPSQGQADPGYDAFSEIDGYEDYADRFIDASTPTDTARIKQGVDATRKDKETLGAAGWAGWAATLAAGATDPLLLFPVGGGLKAGDSVLRGGLAAMRAASLGLTAQEGALRFSQPERTLTQAAEDVAVGTLMAGVLGAGVGALRGDSALFSRISKESTVPAKSDPMQPGFLSLTADDLAADTGETVALPEEAGAGVGGGAQVTNRTDAKLKGALGAERLLRQSSPMLRLSTSAEVETRRATQDLLETPYTYTENALGNAPGPAVETQVKAYQAPLAEATQELDRLYVQYRTGQTEGGRGSRIAVQARDVAGGRHGALSFDEFKEEVGKAMRRGDASPIPEAGEAARIVRQKVIDPPKDAAIEVKLLPPDVQPETAPSYLTRIWNANKIIAKRPDFIRMTVSWLKGEQPKAKARPDAEGRGFSDLTQAELVDIADQIADTLIGTPGGRIHYQAIPVALKSAPSLKERTFGIPDLFSDGTTRVEDFLESDVERVMQFYTRTMAPDIELARKFGTADMAEPIQKIKDAYAKRALSAKNDTQRQRLNKRRDADIRDLSAMRDRLRGTYAAPSDPRGLLSRTTRIVKDWNYLRLMGGMVISSFADAARPVMAEGILRTVGGGLAPMIRNLKAFRLSAAEVKKAGTALDMVLGSRAISLADIGDDFGRNSKFERGLGAAGNIFGTAALMNPWNAALKQFTGVIIQDRILEHTAALAKGTIGKAALERLAASRIDRNAAERIAAQFEKHGEVVDGTRIANTDSWDDQFAVKAYRSAILKDVDAAIITPGVGDKPLVSSKLLGSPELAQLVFQFHSFTFASTQRVLIAGLQRRDAATLNGLILSVGLGMLTYYVKSLQAGKEPSADPGVWVSEGIDRSGVTGSLYDINNIVEKLTRGHVGINALRGGPPMSRYASRNILGAILGPTIGTIQDVTATTGAASDAFATGDASLVTDAEKRAMLRLIPAQNLFYIRSLLDRAAADDTPR